MSGAMQWADTTKKHREQEENFGDNTGGESEQWDYAQMKDMGNYSKLTDD